MVDKDTLKKIFLLNDLPDPILEKIGSIANLETFDEKAVLFEKNQELTSLYMVVSGKVRLSITTAAGESVILDEVFAGRIFGVAALMEESSSSFDAMCAEPSSIVIVSAKKMHQLFVEDFKIGHILMLKMVKLFKFRMERHTRQFLQSLATHPDIKKLQTK
jgi:CRP-like cAMP-binding protein